MLIVPLNSSMYTRSALYLLAKNVSNSQFSANVRFDRVTPRDRWIVSIPFKCEVYWSSKRV